MRKTVASLLVVGTLTSGCVSDGSMQKKDIGTALGAVTGVVAGSFIGSGAGRYVAMAVGGLAGAYLGHELGAALDEQDRRAVDATAGKALSDAGDGETITWANPEKGVRAEITPRETREQTRQVPVLRRKEVAPVPALDLIGETYVAQKSANLRAAPSTDAEITGGLEADEPFTAVGKVQGADWIVVAQNHQTIGYVHASLVGPVPTAAAAPAEAPKPAVNLDELASSEGVDLDAEGLVAENVVATTTCRTVDYKVTSEDETFDEQHTACKGTDGAWEIL